VIDGRLFLDGDVEWEHVQSVYGFKGPLTMPTGKDDEVDNAALGDKAGRKVTFGDMKEETFDEFENVLQNVGIDTKLKKKLVNYARSLRIKEHVKALEEIRSVVGHIDTSVGDKD